jgi:hypothetical protein
MMFQRIETLAHGRILEQEHAGHDFLEVRVVLLQEPFHRFIVVKEIVELFKQGPVRHGTGKKNDSPLVFLEIPWPVYKAR